MANIHATAILEGEIDLADDVEIGPFCVLKGQITIGAGTRLIGNVWLQGPLEMGAANVVYPHTCIGFAPQDYKWDPKRPGAGVRIGDRNIFRESVTVHRATSDDKPTRIGSETMWMVGTHAAHDCSIADHCVMTNASYMGGHAEIAERVIVGGNTGIHQFCRVGRGAMLGGGIVTVRDLPPFFMLTGHSLAGSLNVIGMRRSGMPQDEIEDVRWVYKTLYRRGHSHRRAVEELQTRGERPIVAEYIAFIEASSRGICRGKADPRRG